MEKTLINDIVKISIFRKTSHSCIKSIRGK